MKKLFLTSALAGLGFTQAAVAAPVQWTAASGGNDHWYEVIWNKGGEISWEQAKAAAEALTHGGVAGHLVSITSAAEQAFVNGVNHAFAASSPYHYGNYVTAWIGANDVQSEGNFDWTTGESFTSYSNFASGQPNNWGWHGQDYVQGWWSGDKWNDCSNWCGVHKFVVEYDVSAVPVPASLPLAAAGFGLMGWVGRRRRRA